MILLALKKIIAILKTGCWKKSVRIFSTIRFYTRDLRLYMPYLHQICDIQKFWFFMKIFFSRFLELVLKIKLSKKAPNSGTEAHVAPFGLNGTFQNWSKYEEINIFMNIQNFCMSEIAWRKSIHNLRSVATNLIGFKNRTLFLSSNFRVWTLYRANSHNPCLGSDLEWNFAICLQLWKARSPSWEGVRSSCDIFWKALVECCRLR